MSRYRHALPQLTGDFFLTDGGLETTLIFQEGLELPDFAAFHLLQVPEGIAALNRYFRRYVSIAVHYHTGLILETPTWRANRDWGEKLGYTAATLAEANRHAVLLLEEIRRDVETARTRIVISGAIGPRGDGYVPANCMSAAEAADYHREQIEVFAHTAADMVCAITMNYAEEAIGIAQAAMQAEMPVAISFTVETNGRLPTGQSLRAAIEAVDTATANYPCYYMINCAHPTHIEPALSNPGTWRERIHGLRANASRQSHAELNEAPVLDSGNPRELGAEYAALRGRLPRLHVMGGCCGTDHRHVEEIARACLPLFHPS